MRLCGSWVSGKYIVDGVAVAEHGYCWKFSVQVGYRDIGLHKSHTKHVLYFRSRYGYDVTETFPQNCWVHVFSFFFVISLRCGGARLVVVVVPPLVRYLCPTNLRFRVGLSYLGYAPRDLCLPANSLWYYWFVLPIFLEIMRQFIYSTPFWIASYVRETYFFFFVSHFTYSFNSLCPNV